MYRGRCGAVVSTPARIAGDAGSIPVGAPTNFPSQDSMAGICDPACMGERKKLWEESHCCGSYGTYDYAVLSRIGSVIDGAGSAVKAEESTSEGPLYFGINIIIKGEKSLKYRLTNRSSRGNLLN